MKSARWVGPILAVGMAGALLAGCGGAALGGPTPTPAPRRETCAFEGWASLGGDKQEWMKSQYVIDFPPGYDPNSGTKYPLQVHLHGAAGTAIPFDEFEKNIIRQPFLVNNSDKFPLIILFPQLPTHDLTWKNLTEILSALIDQVVEKYPIDTQRIYLTGYSDGGYGALALGAAYPERFAAIAEVSGYYDENLDELCNLKDTPVLIYHGKKDQVIPLKAEQEVETALLGCKADVTVTLFNSLDHFDITGAVFDAPDLYVRLFSHSLADQQ